MAEMAIPLEDDSQILAEEKDERERKWRSDNELVARLQDAFWPLPDKRKAQPLPLLKREILDELAHQHSTRKRPRRYSREAQSIYDTRDARLARIETRATTLQATVGIATALMVAAAGVVLDSNKVTGGWRDVFAIFLAVLIFSLVMTGWHATRATLKELERDRLRSREAVTRPERTSGYPEQLKSRAIDLIAAANENGFIDFRRTALLLGARRWFFCALALVVGVAALFSAYALFGDVPTSSK
jgi:hypothetical protein